jgi:hypothetical protein
MTVRSTNSVPLVENYDPLGKFLTRTLRLSPLTFGLLLFVADVLVDGWLGWRYDVFLTSSGTPGLLQDYMALVTDFVFNPVICGLYLWVTKGTTRLFQQLHKSSVFKSNTAFINIVNESRSIFLNRKVFYVAIALSLLFALSQSAGYLGWLPWKSVGGVIDLHPSMSYARAPFWFLTVYAISYAAFNVGVTIIILRKTFRTQEIQLLPLHPDGCGGLGSMSQYSTKVALGIASIGLMLSAGTVLEIQQGTLLKAYPVMVGIVGYIVFAPLFFFWPLGTAHEAMQEAKDSEMLRLAQQFDRLYDKVKREVADQDNDYEKSIKKLEHLRKLYQIAQEFPVWPFDMRNLRRFFAVVTTPFIPAVISIVSEIARSVFFP